MIELIPLLAVIGAGLAWQKLSPGGVDAVSLRRHLNALMVYLLVPALVFRVMVQAPLDRHLLYVVIGGWITIAFSGLLAFGLHRLLARYSNLPAATRGALVLAAIFGNGLGAALPLVHRLFDGRQDQVRVTAPKRSPGIRGVTKYAIPTREVAGHRPWPIFSLLLTGALLPWPL